MTSTEESKRKALATLLAEAIVVTDPDLLASYVRDQSRLTAHGNPLAALLPRTTAEVSRCLQVLHDLTLDVVPRGAGSGLSGGANASDGLVVLSLHRMSKVGYPFHCHVLHGSFEALRRAPWPVFGWLGEAAGAGAWPLPRPAV